MRRLAALLLAAAAAVYAGGVRLAPDGWFRAEDGALWVPLGGFHGNVLPLASLKLSAKELRRVEPYIFSAQKTGGLGHIDLWDASDKMLRVWFRKLASEGVTAVRLFPRARVNGDTLDLCGKLNPELQQVFSRAFRAARPYGIRFLLQILPEPTISGYWNHRLVERYALPRYSREELALLTPAQRRFLIDGKHVEHTDWFTDPDVLACQKLYLESALAWVAAEPQVFALEVYNEQGWSRPPPGRIQEFPANWEEAEIAWTAEIVRFIHQRLPGMLVTISHPGSGMTGYDPIRWSRETGVDFYSAHFYGGDCGESPRVDFAAVTAATSAAVCSAVVNFPGEWGVLRGGAPESVRRRAHRDALWLTLLAGAPGFMQWTYEFLDEYRWPARVLRALPRGFSPEPADATEDVAPLWRAFEEDPAAWRPPWFQANPLRRANPNLQRILLDYERSLERGMPLAFRWGGPAAAPEEAPIRAEGGYQLAYLAGAGRSTWIAYLRSRAVRAFGDQFLGVPVKAPLRIRLRLPPARYEAALIDLGSGVMRRFRTEAHSEIDVSPRTDADYVLVLTAERLKF
ncbi:MAG TPA: hypothetical protein VF767_07310 [Bryobacteraceae bacterium]